MTEPIEAEIEAAARMFALLQPDAFSSSSWSGVPCSANWPADFGAGEQDGFRATARAALTAAAQVRERAGYRLPMDSLLRERDEFIVSKGLWNEFINSLLARPPAEPALMPIYSATEDQG